MLPSLSSRSTIAPFLSRISTIFGRRVSTARCMHGSSVYFRG